MNSQKFLCVIGIISDKDCYKNITNATVWIESWYRIKFYAYLGLRICVYFTLICMYFVYMCIYIWCATRKEAVGKIAPTMRDLPLPFHCRVYENAHLAALDPPGQPSSSFITSLGHARLANRHRFCSPLIPIQVRLF